MLPLVNKIVGEAIEAFRANTRGAAFAKQVLKNHPIAGKAIYNQLQSFGAEAVVAQLRTRGEWPDLVGIRGEAAVVDWITEFLAAGKQKAKAA